MARLFPPKLTDGFSAYAVSSEKLVYDKLAAELDNSWYIFHDLKWDDPSLDDSSSVGQADFVIAQSEFGMIVLEVKGGRCSYRASERVWSTEDRHGETAVIKDPFDQAAAGARVIHKLLMKSPLREKIFIPRLQSAALFPDCSMPKEPLCARIPAWRILDQESLFNCRQTVQQLFEAAFTDERRLNRADGLKLIDGLKQLWGVHDIDGRIRLDQRIKNSFAKLVALTEEQQEVLTSLQALPRVLVLGCAGSGKTTLAIHKAKMLAEEGMRVGVFCFNIHLGKYLQRALEGYDSITVGPFAELCQRWLTEAGVPWEMEDKQTWWDETLPNLVVDNLDRIPHRFDALVVDEGQDIKENYWPAMELLLDAQGEPVVYVFADRRQDLYRGTIGLSVKPAPYSLNRNIRNTDPVFRAVKACCNLASDIRSSGVDGPKPHLYPYETEDDMRRQLERIIEELCVDGVALGDIVVLGTRKQNNTCLKHGEKLGAFRLVESRQKSGDLITMTIHKFKGLEANVVILCELDDYPRKMDELLYVGMTRSTGHVIALAKEPVYGRLERAGLRVMDGH